MKRVRDELGYSYPLIGRIFGRDHASIIWACRGGRKNQPSRAKQPQEMAA
jgi:chromosomal replication initiation ATPase DnaA